MSDEQNKKMCATGKILIEVFLEDRPHDTFWVEDSISDEQKLTGTVSD